MIWFTSDLHFGHKNILDYCNRPFGSVERMNEMLIHNFNQCVSNDDVTYFLGDIFFCDNELATEILAQMNGTKVLVRGNHDQSVNTMYKIGFDVVVESARLRIGKTYVNLSHYPYKRTFWNHLWKKHFDKKYRSKLHFNKLEDNGEWLLHGHTHDKSRLKGRMIHVGVDAWNYKPVPQTVISSIIAKEMENAKKW